MSDDRHAADTLFIVAEEDWRCYIEHAEVAVDGERENVLPTKSHPLQQSLESLSPQSKDVKMTPPPVQMSKRENTIRLNGSRKIGATPLRTIYVVRNHQTLLMARMIDRGILFSLADK